MITFETYAITLAQDTERYRSFCRNNSHLAFEPFDAVRGQDLSLETCVADGLITRECAASGLVTRGLLGSAASHRALWRRAAESRTSLLILEDDVLTHRDIGRFIESRPVLNTLDACLFTLNTDSVMCATSPQGIRQTTLFHPRHPSEAAIAKALAATDLDRVALWRYHRGFGIACMLVTPQGGRRLVESIFPLSLDTVNVPLISDRMPGISTDRRLNAVSHLLKIAVAQPFLAYTPNTDSATLTDK